MASILLICIHDPGVDECFFVEEQLQESILLYQDIHTLSNYLELLRGNYHKFSKEQCLLLPSICSHLKHVHIQIISLAAILTK